MVRVLPVQDIMLRPGFVKGSAEYTYLGCLGRPCKGVAVKGIPPMCEKDSRCDGDLTRYVHEQTD